MGWRVVTATELNVAFLVIEMWHWQTSVGVCENPIACSLTNPECGQHIHFMAQGLWFYRFWFLTILDVFTSCDCGQMVAETIGLQAWPGVGAFSVCCDIETSVWINWCSLQVRRARWFSSLVQLSCSEQIAFNNTRVKIARLDNLSGSRSFGHKWLNYLISSLISGT